MSSFKFILRLLPPTLLGLGMTNLTRDGCGTARALRLTLCVKAESDPAITAPLATVTPELQYKQVISRLLDVCDSTLSDEVTEAKMAIVRREYHYGNSDPLRRAMDGYGAAAHSSYIGAAGSAAHSTTNIGAARPAWQGLVEEVDTVKPEHLVLNIRGVRQLSKVLEVIEGVFQMHPSSRDFFPSTLSQFDASSWFYIHAAKVILPDIYYGLEIERT